MSNVVKIPVSTRLQEEVPVPKSRRVLPEHEGRYKIKMPSGTTAKTQKILEQGLPAGIYTKNWDNMFALYIRKWNIVRFAILVHVLFLFMKGFCIKYKNLKVLASWE